MQIDVWTLAVLLIGATCIGAFAGVGLILWVGIKLQRLQAAKDAAACT